MTCDLINVSLVYLAFSLVTYMLQVSGIKKKKKTVIWQPAKVLALSVPSFSWITDQMAEIWQNHGRMNKYMVVHIMVASFLDSSLHPGMAGGVSLGTMDCFVFYSVHKLQYASTQSVLLASIMQTHFITSAGGIHSNGIRTRDQLSRDQREITVSTHSMSQHSMLRQ